MGLFRQVYDATAPRRMSSCVVEPSGSHRLTIDADPFDVPGPLCAACLDEDFDDEMDVVREHDDNQGSKECLHLQAQTCMRDG